MPRLRVQQAQPRRFPLQQQIRTHPRTNAVIMTMDPTTMPAIAPLLRTGDGTPAPIFVYSGKLEPVDVGNVVMVPVPDGPASYKTSAQFPSLE